MRLTLSVYVTVTREEGRSVFSCRPLRGNQIVTRDPLLSIALTKLGNKLRKSINELIAEGKTARLSDWLYEADTQARTLKLMLTLRDRTLRWKLLIVSIPAFSRYVVFSPSIPEVAFEVDSLVAVEARAREVFTDWALAKVAEGSDFLLDQIGESGEVWIEPLEIEVETTVGASRKPKNILAALLGGGKTSGSEELHKVGHCLDEFSSDYETALGRGELVEELDRILQREDRQGVLIVGPPAVGKTAIIQDCVRRRSERFRQRRGQKPQVWWLSPQRLISGMSYLGQWEQRWLAILREAAKRDHILYFDELVGLFTAGRTRDSSLSAADVLRGFLSEHRVRILAEATAEQLAVLRRRDRALADRFHLLYVPALSSQDALPIVLEASQRIEIRSERFFHPETVPLIIRHQETFAPDQAFPGKAIEMCKTLSKHATQVVDRESVYRLAGSQLGASQNLLFKQFGNQRAIEFALSRKLIGQPTAVEALSRTVIRYCQQMQPPDRPLGVLLLLGPTGVGKTEAAKALTRLLYTEESHLVRLDMNELTTPYAAEQLVGTFDQPDGRLTAAVRRQPNCVILLDEIEKAHPDVFDYLLQVLGEGRLTDARGRVADFRSAIIVLTSNLGASEQNASLGFEITAERRQQIYIKAAQQFFRPEFFNRIDEVVPFRNLAPQDMEAIVAIQMDQVLSRDGIKRRNVFVHVHPSAIKQVIQRGFDSKLGARAVRRMLESEIIGPLADCLSRLQVDKPALIQISHASAAAQLDCRVRELTVAAPRLARRIASLEKLIPVGKVLHDHLDWRLSELAPELAQIDQQVSGKSHGASYYALREQLYRCAELLKAAEAQLTRKFLPRIHAGQLPTKPRRAHDAAGSRRGMKDWQAQQDLHSAISDQPILKSRETPSHKELAKKIVDSLTIASAMIDAALTPRQILVGFEPLTSGVDLLRPNSNERPGSKVFRPRDEFDGYVDPLRSAEVLQLIDCLRYRWHYDVSSAKIAGEFWLVSGVAVLGIIRPLLGTYRTETRAGASHLQVLRAIAVNANLTDSELIEETQAGRLVGVDGELQTPGEQPLPTTVIRGAIDENWLDLVSGSTVPISLHSWLRDAKQMDKTLQWWTDCLPVPQELLEQE